MWKSILFALESPPAHKAAIMKRCFLPAISIAAIIFVSTAGNLATAADNPYLGEWALTIPGGAAGWLGVREADGKLEASLLWGGGSVLPLDSARVENGKLVLTRVSQGQRKKANPANAETITATADGDVLKLTISKPRAKGNGEGNAEFTGHRQPPVPPAPDLARVKFGEPIRLFNGKDLTGWRLTHPDAVSAWSVVDGILVNAPMIEEGKPHKRYGNLRTEAEFEDFNLTLEANVSKGENSGVYVRGIYEIQVIDSYGKPLDPHNMGAVYSRITPTVSAEKPADEWQTLDITFVHRHMTVILNGQKIIDNQPVAGCTGGALWSDINRPGPIYLQGDHTGAKFRNLILRPVVRVQ
jgi:hypothetical protein